MRQFELKDDVDFDTSKAILRTVGADGTKTDVNIVPGKWMDLRGLIDGSLELDEDTLLHKAIQKLTPIAGYQVQNCFLSTFKTLHLP